MEVMYVCNASATLIGAVLVQAVSFSDYGSGVLNFVYFGLIFHFEFAK